MRADESKLSLIWRFGSAREWRRINLLGPLQLHCPFILRGVIQRMQCISAWQSDFVYQGIQMIGDRRYMKAVQDQDLLNGNE